MNIEFIRARRSKMNMALIYTPDDEYTMIDIIDFIDNQQQEIDRLNNIINELEKTLEEQISNPLSTEFKLFSKMVLNDLKQLKGDN